MSKKTCPKCGESNPEEAVMCWACYTELTPPTRIRQAVWKAAARLGISPYPRAVRHSQKASRIEGQRDPIERIMDTILQYANRDAVSDIFIEPQEKGVRILYRIDGEVQEQMKVPIYVLQPLTSHIRERGRKQEPGDTARIDFVWDGKAKIWSVRTERTEFGEKVILSTQRSV